MARKSEVIVIKIDNKVIIKRIPINLPFHELEETKGFMGQNVIYDISGAIESIENFKQALIEIKNCHDGLNGKLLNNTAG